MSYGDNKRNQMDKAFGPLSVMGFGTASALGIATAVVVDLLQAREASALYMMNRWLLEVTGMMGVEALPLSAVMGILMAIGAGSIFVTEPISMRGAYVQGFGALAVLMTMAPSDLGAPLQAPDYGPSMQSNPSLREQFEPASLTQFRSTKVAAQEVGSYDLRIQVEFSNGLEGSLQEMLRRKKLVGKLYNKSTGIKYDLFRNSGAEMDYDDGTLRIVTSMDASAQKAELWLLIEAEGYRITEERFIASVGPNPIWNVQMQTSRQPLIVQRLRHAYRF
ncbi:hypothetical protein [Parvularcula maris]|uniref:Uncharacterized protein n=1 Tax=Parvularcula maris TaxID=2965077 RepID=A0A9X2L9A0_9PROT|nr:hypothetical protein [Parvularcula maris]MCQ8185466.1 hypothetical protein [Parvularcula maris]